MNDSSTIGALPREFDLRSSVSPRRARPTSRVAGWLAAGCLAAGCLAAQALLASCGGGGASSGSVDQAPVGTAATKPGSDSLINGGAYRVDPNEGGTAQGVQLLEMSWGRLVDVFDTVEGSTESRLIYPDMVIGEDVRTATEGGILKWELTSNPVTGDSSLRINAEVGSQLFDFRIAEAVSGLKPIEPKGLAVTELPPFSLVARNAALSVRFSDLVDENTVGLHSTVKILTGDPATTPFDARVFPDPNHGGIGATDGNFHSSRLVIDFTISDSELGSLGQVVQANGVGLPESPSLLSANVVLRIPTQVAPAVGQFSILKNLKGKGLDQNLNDPLDLSSTTVDVVRAMRSGNGDDENNGFLVDLDQPRIVGVQPVTITAVVPDTLDPDAVAGRDFLVSFQFATQVCALDPVAGDVVQISNLLRFDVDSPATVVGTTAVNVAVTVPLDQEPVSDPAALVGLPAQHLTAWRSNLPAIQAPCFLRFSPSAAQLPAARVSPNAQVLVRFSEPLNPASVRPFDSFAVARISTTDPAASTGPTAPLLSDLVLGSVVPSPDFREYRFVPSVPFRHTEGQAERYYFNLISEIGSGVSDLAGNPLLDELPKVEFVIDSIAATQNTGGWVMRFNSTNEDGQTGPEVRGQFLFNTAEGSIRPRPVQRFSAVVDRTQALPGVMQTITTGLQTPLASAGSKAHLMWRYTDAGFTVSQTDDSFYNLDLEGVSLSPLGGQVTSTIYDEFEMQMGHARRIPDEVVDPLSLLPIYPNSGFEAGNSFAENYLPDPLSGPKLVHPRQLGFAVSNAQVFVATTGSNMLRMPWNTGMAESSKVFFTWRNTESTATGNLDASGGLVGEGVPLVQEVAVIGLSNIPGDVYGTPTNGSNGVDNIPGVPTVGLPLLMEYRCYPTEEPSLNNFDVSIAVTSSNRPFFRAFSTGGTNSAGLVINKDPDLEPEPTGGFNGNPAIAALGAPTIPRDPTVYMGQMDVVLRISRVHTILVDAEQSPTLPTPAGNPQYDYVTAVVEPNSADQPTGTSVVFAYRGDDRSGLAANSVNVLNASNLDVYGNIATGPLKIVDAMGAVIVVDPLPIPLFGFGQPQWGNSLDSVDGLRYVQVRITFISNTASLLSPTLNSFGLAFRR
jgi:hypothetical protein